MGWFRSKYKHVQSITFQQLKGAPFSEWRYARRQIYFAMAGSDALNLTKELWKYKHDSKKNIPKRLAIELNSMPQTIDVNTVSYDDIRKYIEEETNITDFQSIAYVDDKENTILGHEDSDPPIEDVIQEYMNREHPDMAYLRYDDEEDYYYYCNQSDGDPDEDTIRWKILDRYFQNDKKEAVLEYHDYTYHTETTEDDPDTEEDESSEELVQDDGSDHVLVFDCSEYFYAKVYYVNTDNEIDPDAIIFVPYEYYTNGPSSTTNTNTVEFAPIFQLKGDNEPVDVQKKQQKMLDYYGVQLDSVKGMISNGDIDDFRISYAVAPDDAIKSAAIAKYLYYFFEQVGGADWTGREDLGDETNKTLTFEIAGLNVKQRFYLETKDESGTIPRPSDFAEYKVRLRQTTANADKYYDDVKSIYDDAIGGSETEIKAMYVAVVNAYKNDPDAYKSYYDKLPPKDYFKENLKADYTYVYCVPADMEDILHDELFDEDGNREWEIESYTKFNTINTIESEKFYVIVEKKEKQVYTKENGQGQVNIAESVWVTLYYQLDPDNYRVYQYRNAVLNYDIDGHTAYIRHLKMDGSFRLFMLDGYLKGKPYKEFMSIHDKSLCGLIYVHQKIKIKWYQRSGFRLFLQIAAIVITVVTGGVAGAVAIVINTALNIAVAYVAQKLASMIGGELGAVMGTVVAVAAIVVSQGTSPTMWFAVADQYLKLKLIQTQEKMEKLQKNFEEYKKELDKKERMMRAFMASYKDYSKETIIKNIANRAYNEGFSDIKFDVETITELEENEWRMPEVQMADYNLGETEYNRVVNFTDGLYDFSSKVHQITYFGADPYNQQP
jgi:hypothetical protein